MSRNTVIINNNTNYSKELARLITQIDPNFEFVGFFVSDDDPQIARLSPDLILASDELFFGGDINILLNNLEKMEGTPLILGLMTYEENRPTFIEHNLPFFNVSANPIEQIASQIATMIHEYDFLESNEGELDNPEHRSVQSVTQELQKSIRYKERLMEDERKKNEAAKQAKTKIFRMDKKVVAVYSPKGGAGKTTLSIELSHFIAHETLKLVPELKKRDFSFTDERVKVCLVDWNASLDTMSSTLASIKEYKGQRISVLDWMDVIDQKVNHAISSEKRKLIDNGELLFENAYTIDDIQFEDEEIEELVIMDKETGLYIVPAIPLLTELKRCKPKYLDIMLNALRNFFDIVMIDTSNNVSLFSITAMKHANMTLIVSAPNVQNLATIGKFKRALPQLQLSAKNMHLVLNNANYTKMHVLPADCESAVDIAVLGVISYEPGLCDSYEKGVAFAVSATEKNKFRREISDLAESILPLRSVLPEKKSPFKSLFSRSK